MVYDFVELMRLEALFVFLLTFFSSTTPLFLFPSCLLALLPHSLDLMFCGDG